MPKFIYKAKRGLEQTFEGTIDAEDQKTALTRLMAQGLFPITITEARLPESDARKAKRSKRRKRKIATKEILNFVQKLTTLTKAKVELLPSLKILYEQTENAAFQDVILEIYNATKEGKTFSESLKRFPALFSPLFVSIIRAGEASGHLDASLEQINEFMYREESLKTKVLVALAYPVLLLFVGLVTIFVLINFVIPRLRPIFESLGKDLPVITKIILRISAISHNIWWLIAGAFGLFAAALYLQKGNPLLRRIGKNIQMHLPLLKGLAAHQELSYFARSLALLLKSGVPALKSLEIVTPSIEDPKLRSELQKTCQQVAAGQSLSKSMQAFTSLPDFFVKMIAVGEESGSLSEVLDEISHSYTQQIESDITLISSLLEPVLILLLGVVLGVIILSILLPTFQVTQIVR